MSKPIRRKIGPWVGLPATVVALGLIVWGWFGGPDWGNNDIVLAWFGIAFLWYVDAYDRGFTAGRNEEWSRR